MILAQKKIALKDGTECVLRTPDKDDAQQMISLLKLTSGETDFLIRYPEEVTFTVEREEALLSDMADRRDFMMIGAFVDGDIAGTCSFGAIGDRAKLKHRCQMGIAIKKEFWHSGIGKALIEESVEQARAYGFEQMELEVVSANTRAIRLYEKMGFEVYGVRRNAFKLKDGTYYSEFLMMKRL